MVESLDSVEPMEVKLPGALRLTQPSLNYCGKMSSNGNVVKVTIGLVEKAGHHLLMNVDQHQLRGALSLQISLYLFEYKVNVFGCPSLLIWF